MSKWIGNSGVGKALKNTPTGKWIEQGVENLANSKVYKAVDNFEKSVQFYGTAEEFLEEQVGTILNAALIGDSELSDITDAKNQLQTLVQVGIMGGAFSAVKATGYRSPKSIAKKEMNTIRMSAEQDKIDNPFLISVLNEIDNATDYNSAIDVASKAVFQENIDKKDIENVRKYLALNANINGYEEGKNSNENSSERRFNTSIFDAFDSGYTSENPKSIYDEYMNIRSEFTEEQITELENVSSPVEYMKSNGNVHNKEMLFDYFSKAAMLRGVGKKYMDEADSETEAYARKMKGHAMVNPKTGKNGDVIHTVLIKDDGKEVRASVIRGKVLSKNNGSNEIDYEKSDNAITVRILNGKTGMVDVKNILSSVAIESVNELTESQYKQAKEDAIAKYKREVIGDVSDIENSQNENVGNPDKGVEQINRKTPYQREDKVVVDGVEGMVEQITPEGNYIVSFEDRINYKGHQMMVAEFTADELRSRDQSYIEQTNSDKKIMEAKNEFAEDKSGEVKHIDAQAESAVQNNEQQSAEILQFPVDKAGSIDYDAINDANMFYEALKEDFSEDGVLVEESAINVINGYLKDAQKEIKSSERMKNIAEAEKKRMRLRKRIKMLEEVLSNNFISNKIITKDKMQVAPQGEQEQNIDSGKQSRIEKLRNSTPVEITGEEIAYSGDLKDYRRNALEYGKSLRGVYTNADTKQKIYLSRKGIEEALHHDNKEYNHIQSIAAIAQIIENSIYIDSRINEDIKKHPEISHYDYYVCGLKIGNEDYTVKAVIGVSKEGKRYYDHRLTEIEKSKLISTISNLTMSEEENGKPLSDVKDRRLISILQNNSSEKEAPTVNRGISQDIVDKWNSADKEIGAKDIITLPNGKTLNGRWVMTEAFSITPSHDPVYLKPTEGFPTAENGGTINDNDYSTKRAEIESKAQQFDARAIDNPIIVQDGIVLSGNNRTMSSILAAERGTDNAYNEALPIKASQRGFVQEQIDKFEHPRLVFELSEKMPLTTETFAMFNQRETKSKSPIERAIVAGKIIDEGSFNRIAVILDGYDKLSDLYSSLNDQREILHIMLSNGLINQNDVAEIFTESGFTQSGKSLVESLVIGGIVGERQLRLLDTAGMRKHRAKIVKNAANILLSAKIDKSVINDVNDAIDYLAEAYEYHENSLHNLISQLEMFDQRDAFNVDGLHLAILFDSKESRFKEFWITLSEALKEQGEDLFGNIINKSKIYEQYRRGHFDATEHGNIDKAQSRGGAAVNQVADASQSGSANSAIGQEGGVSTESSEKIQGNSTEVGGSSQYEFLANGGPVVELDKSVFDKKEGVTLTEQVEQYYNSIGNSAVSPYFGEIVLDKKGADNSLAHGIGRIKAIAFKAVPDIIEKGIVILPINQHKGDDAIKSGMLAAPIKIDEQEYIGVVVVRENRSKKKSLYVHEVTLEKRLQDVRSNPVLQEDAQATNHGAVAKVLQNIFSAKKQSNENSEYGYNEDPSQKQALNNHKAAPKKATKSKNKWEHITGSDNDILFRDSEQSEEVDKIVNEAIANGTYLKAPNGNDSNLSAEQWALVRTDAFKKWFGDWGKQARIEKLRNSTPVEITGEEHVGKYELTLHSSQKYILDNFRGEYFNSDTGDKITISRVGAKKVTSHDTDNINHLQSIIAIPSIIENAIFITEDNNLKNNGRYDSYKYYVTGLNIGGVDYTVRLTVGVKNGVMYYDHGLTEIEKGTLLDSLERTQKPVAEKKSSEYEKQVPLSQVKDRRLISILQNNSSKVVDENFEPMVVYHGTNKEFYQFDTNKVSATAVGSFFTSDKEIASEYKGNVSNRFRTPNLIEAFLNLRNPFDYDNNQKHKDIVKNYFNEMDNKDLSHRQKLIDERIFLEKNFDGEIRGGRKNNSITFIVFNPTQIKSATANNGEFSASNSDIRYKGDILAEDRKINAKFNSELEQQVNGTLDKKHIYQLGNPNEILLSCGIPDLPIELKSSRLLKKSEQENHIFKLNDIYNLPNTINNPLMIFNSKTIPNSRVILTELSDGYKNYIVAIHATNDNVSSRKNLQINEIKSIYPKDFQQLLKWITNDDLLQYADKNRATMWLGKQQSNSADVAIPNNSPTNDTANISQNIESAIEKVKNFDNPTLLQGEKLEAIEQISQNLGVEVDVIADKSHISGDRKRSSKGWFDIKTGKVTILVENHATAEDCVQTYLHEVVAHKGLRELLGEEFDNFLDNVYENADNSVKKRIDAFNGDKRVATEEYIASLAEKGFKERANRHIWESVKRLFRDLIRRGKLAIGFNITDNDIRYMLWRSYNNLQKRKGLLDNLDKTATDAVLRNECNIDNSTLRYRGSEQLIQDGIHQKYEEITQTINYKLREGYQDSMLSLKKVQEIIEKEIGRKLYDHENAYIEENQLASKNLAEKERFDLTLKNELIEAMVEIEKSGVKGEQISNYIYAKHGVERNEFMASREANRAYDSALNEIIKNKTLSEEQKEAEIKKLESVESLYDRFIKKDYSGLEALTQSDIDFMVKSKEIISEFEGKFKGSTDILWQKINAISNFSLKKSYESGLISLDQYQEIGLMYKFYVPFRGWQENKVSDLYEYLETSNVSLNGTVIAAKGRSSLANDPLATLINMAYSSIVLGNKNMVKMSFFNTVRNNPSTLYNISKKWYVKDVVTEVDKIVNEAIANGTYLKAPNGNDSNLSAEQWALVRTDAFKKWFGDWELATKKVDIVKAKTHEFKNFTEAKQWAKKNITRIYSNIETGGKGAIEISRASIDKYFNESAVSKSENIDVHKSVITVLPEIIKNSVVGETHFDYIKKGGVRAPQNGIVPNTEIRRLFGAVEIGGAIYRVKTTVKYFTDSSANNKAHSYEVIKIELLDESNSSERNQDSQTVSPIPTTKLLKGIEYSYEKGKFIFNDFC